jgi:superfamily II DNA or RNA helicase
MCKLDHWNKNTVQFLRQHLNEAVRDIRIATGFFTVQGYDLLRSALLGKQVMILVGFDETSAERLKDKMVEDIMAHLARWDTENRRDAVLDLVRKMQDGELRIVERESIDLIDARIRQGDHAKLYILDDSAVFVGSSNLTVSGLRHNVEAVAGHDAPERVHQWVDWFQHYWDAKDTYDLTQALLEALLRWLDFVPPHDIYLKTILALMPEDTTPAPRASYKMPVAYQQVVIERMLRQLQDWRGAFLVASTGLGKTIMATHTAYRLQQLNHVLNVLVFAPKPVLDDWKRALSSAGVSAEYFTRDLLDQPVRGEREGRRMMVELERVDDRYLIFIDESHELRNRMRATGDQERRSFERLVDIIKRKQPRVILLTATPFATEIENLNNQLYLLPHTAPRTTVRSDGQSVLDIFADDLLEQHVWQVPETETFFEQFMQLPVCTVISTSHVAKNFATQTEEGEYIDFGEQRKWLPRIAAYKIRAPVPFEVEMSEILDEGYFNHKPVFYKSRRGFHRTETNIEKQALIAWTSSPLALAEVLTRTIDDTYNVDFLRPQAERKQALQPLVDRIKQLTYATDAKFQALVLLLERCLEQKQKVLLFTERHATAIYLERGLAHLVPAARIANVVQETEAGGYELKQKEVYDLIYDFAPVANSDKIADRPQQQHYDVFITTDAFSAGVNLQDASIVISYDLAWTPEVIIQRAGRILRFWIEPRQVELYVFVSMFEIEPGNQQGTHKVQERLQRLMQRIRQAEKFSELPIIPEGDSAVYERLGSLTAVTTEYLGKVDITQVEEFTGASPFLAHIAELKQYQTHAQEIPDDITSARQYDGSRHLMYLLLRHQGEFHWTLYDIRANQLIERKEDALLNLLACPEQTTPPPITPTIVEQYAQLAKKHWMTSMAIDTADTVQRICALYFIPETADIAAMLREVLTP